MIGSDFFQIKYCFVIHVAGITMNTGYLKMKFPDVYYILRNKNDNHKN